MQPAPFEQAMIWLAVIDNSKLMHPANGSEFGGGAWAHFLNNLEIRIAGFSCRPQKYISSPMLKKMYNTRPVLKKIYLVALNVADTIYRFNIIVKNAHVD